MTVKIAIFTDSYRPYVSGVVRSIDTFATELLNLGHEVYIFAPRYYQREDTPPAVPSSPSSRLQIFRFLSVPLPGYPGFTAPVPVSFRAEALLRQIGIQVVHTQGPFALGGLGAVLARKLRLPLVFTHHTMYHEYVHYLPGARKYPTARQWWQRLILGHVNRYCRRADLVIAPTPQIRDFITKTYDIKDDRVISIPTGIPVEDYRHGDKTWLRRRFSIPDTDPVMIFVGRLGQEKNIPFLLESMVIINAYVPQAHLVLVGDGPERQRLEHQVAGMGLQGRVHFAGSQPRERVIDAFHGSDLFVIASVTETQGLATLEAMAAGLPVVGVDAPGTHDLVRHGVDGYLTPHDTRSFAQAVVQLLANPARRRQMAGNAVAGAGVFSSRNTALQLVAAYEKLIS